MQIIYQNHPMNPHFNAKIAKYLKNDLTAATILESLKSWIDCNARNGRNFRDGHFWTYNTIEEWSKQLVFCTPKVFYKKISKLRDLGLIYTEKYNKKKGNHTLWYTINYDFYSEIACEDSGLAQYKNYLLSNSQQEPENNLPNDEGTTLLFKQEGKIDIDFPDPGTSYIVTNNNNNKKRENKRRGWYLSPVYQDLETWVPSNKLSQTIKLNYDLQDEEIENALKEFVLYNKAKGSKFKFLDPIFELWCKRYKRFKRVVKRGYRKVATVACETYEKVEKAMIRSIDFLKDQYSKTILSALLKHFGPVKYKEMRMCFFQLKPKDANAPPDTIEFVGITPFMLDQAEILRKHRDDIKEALKMLGYRYKKVLICDG